MTNALLDKVSARITPGPDERAGLEEMADCIISLIDRTALNKGLPEVKGILVGSAARDTWISGEHDLDIFIMFPAETSEKDLKSAGLDIAKEVSREADCFEERYAEHPYIHAFFKEFEVDLVPSFRVASAASIKSAVDRTPFHNQFVLSKIGGLEPDVLLLKQFMKGAEVYGSDLKTGGFSGYLAELLIINYGAFHEVVKAADEWKPGTVIDIAGHGSKEHTDPLVVVDPTDPERNVAAALTVEKFARFIDAARKYLESPSLELFFPPPVLPLGDLEFNQIMAGRGTSLVAVVFDKPDIVDDILYPQMFMLHKSMRDMVERHGFLVYYGEVWAGKRSASIVLEMLVRTLPSVKIHFGPPVWAKQHAVDFEAKHGSGGGFTGVYIRDGKLAVDVQRKYTDAAELINGELLNCRLGKHIGVNIKAGFKVLNDQELLQINDESFRKFLRIFLKKTDVGHNHPH